MAWNAKTDSITGIIKFSLTDDDGDTIASFKINPTDIHLADRLEKAGAAFGALAKDAPDRADLAKVREYNDQLEDILATALGCICRADLFGVMPAITIMPSGKLYALELFEQITATVGPEITKRHQKMQAAVGKHTAKYVPQIPDEVIEKAMAAAAMATL